MRRWWMTALVLASVTATASEPLTREQYEEKYDLRQGDETDQAALERCLDAWGTHPFGDGPYRARWLETQVRAMGIGKEDGDFERTSWPQLVFVKPAVNVMTKTTLRLDNPNGWYCLEANVTVMGKLVLEADCGAKIADSRTGATVLGWNDAEGGVTVLGSTRVERTGTCPTAAPPAAP